MMAIYQILILIALVEDVVVLFVKLMAEAVGWEIN